MKIYSVETWGERNADQSEHDVWKFETLEEARDKFLFIISQIPRDYEVESRGQWRFMKDRVFCCELLEEDEDADFCETIEHYRWTFEDNNAYNDYDGTWNDFVSERNMLILNR